MLVCMTLGTMSVLAPPTLRLLRSVKILRVFLTPPSHHWATLLLRPADVESVGGYDVGYDECSRTTDFLTAPGRLYIVQSKQHKLSTPPTHHQTTLSLRPADVGRIGCYEFGQN